MEMRCPIAWDNQRLLDKVTGSVEVDKCIKDWIHNDDIKYSSLYMNYNWPLTLNSPIDK